jgi:hypothetical protein
MVERVKQNVEKPCRVFELYLSSPRSTRIKLLYRSTVFVRIWLLFTQGPAVIEALQSTVTTLKCILWKFTRQTSVEVRREIGAQEGLCDGQPFNVGAHCELHLCRRASDILSTRPM